MRDALLACVLVLVASGCGGPSSDGSSDDHAAAGSTDKPGAASAPDAGDGSPALPRVRAAPRSNRYVQLGVTEAGFDPAGGRASHGVRQYTIGLRGVGRAGANDFVLEFQPFVFAQNDRGCISRPIPDAAWLSRPFGPTAVFSIGKTVEGQLAFLVPEDTRRIRVLIAPTGGGALIVPAGEDFEPSWPTPIQTIEDGTTLRVLVLPAPETLPVLSPPATGTERVVLDFVVENLMLEQGIEFATSQQLRLVAPTGGFIQAAAATKEIGCRLDDGDVIPPGHVRRFMVAYEMPAGAPRRLQYRGFEVDEISVDVE